MPYPQTLTQPFSKGAEGGSTSGNVFSPAGPAGEVFPTIQDASPGGPNWPSQPVTGEGSLSLTTNVSPGERVGATLLARGVGPAGESSDVTYKAVLNGQTVASKDVTVRGGSPERMDFPDFTAPSTRGERTIKLLANGQVVDRETLAVGGQANAMPGRQGPKGAGGTATGSDQQARVSIPVSTADRTGGGDGSGGLLAMAALLGAGAVILGVIS